MSSMDDATVGGAPAPKVVVVAEGPLVGETIVVALQEQGFEVTDLAFPRGRIDLGESRRTVADTGIEVGIVVAEVDDVAQWRDVMSLLAAMPIRWVLVTGSDNRARWGSLLDAGLRGVVRMVWGLDMLERSVRTLATGGPGMDPVLRNEALEAWDELGPLQHETIRRIAALSPREWVVLEMLNDGHSITTIAEDGGVSEGTVRSQVRAIRQKLNVRSQLAAVAAFQQAIEFGQDHDHGQAPSPV